jgi:hypothetical protein
MKALFYLLIFAFLVFIQLFPYRKIVTGEHVGENLKLLKKHQWFNDYLKDEKYKKLIVHNEHVRQTIGRFNTNKLGRESYLVKCKKKLNQVLTRELNRANET